MDNIQKITDKVSSICPICQKEIEIKIDTELLKSGDNFPLAYTIKHCQKTIIVYIDRNLKVRAVESAYIAMEAEQNSEDIFNDLPKEEKTIFQCNIKSTNIDYNKFPNILERQLFRLICKSSVISLNSLYENVKGLQSALNMEFSPITIEKTLQKYVDEGIIEKIVY